MTNVIMLDDILVFSFSLVKARTINF